MPTYVFLQVDESLVGLALDLQALRPQQEPLCEAVVESQADTQVVDGLFEALAAREG
jgi:hypothetical protein